MRRFFVPHELLREEHILLPEETLHHIRVLRLSAGDEISLLDGRGTLCRCRIHSVDRRTASAQVLHRESVHESAFPVHLLQALPKGDKFDLVLQKGTELGVSVFTPFYSSRSIPLPARNRESERVERWRRIVREASRQCGRNFLPTVHPPAPLLQAAGEVKEELRLMLWEEESHPLEEYLGGIRPESAALMIGPEGGFSVEEADAIRKMGFHPVRIGPRILRTETAGIAVASILQFLFGDLGSAKKSWSKDGF